MTTPSQSPQAAHEALADDLRESPPRMDDLRRARLERRVLARARGSSTSQEVAAVTTRPRPALIGSRSARMAFGALALAAAGLIGFVVRGAMGPAEPAGPHFAIGSAFETREGTLTSGSRVSLASGEEGRLEIGDVTAALRDGGALEVRSVDPDDVRLVLERGTAELAFHPHARGRQHLRIETPSAEVEVVGTVFTVRVDQRGTTVSVREGTVRVTGRGGDATPVLVHAGESVSVPAHVETASADPGDVPEAVRVVTTEAVVASAALTPLDVAPVSVEVDSLSPARERVVARAGEVNTAGDVSTEAVEVAEPAAAAEAITGTGTGMGAGTGAGGGAGTETDTGSATAAEVGAGTTASGATDLASPFARPSPMDSWAAHRPSSREIAAAWHDIDELQARGQFERSLALLVRLERYAPASDQDEALFDRARTVQEALRRPRAARALYSEYVRRFPMGRHLQEVRRRLVALGAPAEGDPPPAEEPTAPPADELILP